MMHKLIPWNLWDDIAIEIRDTKVGHQRFPTYLKSMLRLAKFILDEFPADFTGRLAWFFALLIYLPFAVPYHLYLCYKVRSYFHIYPEELL